MRPMGTVTEPTLTPAEEKLQAALRNRGEVATTAALGIARAQNLTKREGASALRSLLNRGVLLPASHYLDRERRVVHRDHLLSLQREHLTPAHDSNGVLLGWWVTKPGGRVSIFRTVKEASDAAQGSNLARPPQSRPRSRRPSPAMRRTRQES